MSNGDPAVEEAKEQESEERDIEEERPLAAPEEGEKGEIVREEDILPFDPKLLEDAPPEVRQLIKMSSAMIRMGGPSFNPLVAAVAKTLDGDHLAAVIKSMDRSTELEHDSVRRAHLMNLLCLIALLIFAGFALWLLKDSDPDLLKYLFGAVVTLAGGAGVGYGYKAWRDEQRR